MNAMKEESIARSTITDTLTYQGLCLRGTELASYMEINKDTLFYGRSFSRSSIASMSSRGVIPSTQMKVEGKTAIKKERKILQTYDIAEISRWCRLGATREACLQVVKERKNG
jgi:hypothetical protein